MTTDLKQSSLNKMMPMRIKFAAGVALIQVLFITSILSLMALHFTQTGRQQVAVGTVFQDKISAELELISWQSELLYALSTTAIDTEPTAGVDSNRIAQVWNFYGKPFSPEQDVTIRIQDSYGLVSVTTEGQLHEVTDILRQMSFSDSEVTAVITQLELQRISNGDFQQNRSGDNTGPLRSIEQLASAAGLSLKQLEQLKQNFTVLPVSMFNPLTSSDARLKAFLPAETAAKVIEVRNEGQLDAAKFLALTGITDYEQMSFVPGQLLMVELQVTKGEAVAKSSFICYIRPENQFPLIWLD